MSVKRTGSNISCVLSIATVLRILFRKPNNRQNLIEKDVFAYGNGFSND